VAVTRTLAVRLDALGDVLLMGPALRALANTSDRLTLLAGPRGAAAAALLPGVEEVIAWSCPWIEPGSPAVRRDDVDDLVRMLAGRFDRAVVFTSFHQDPLPTALLLRLAGVGWIGAISEDYPGGLLDLRHRVPDLVAEPDRALSLAVAAGGRLDAGDDGRLRLRDPLPGLPLETGLTPPYVVLHPGTSVPARAWPAERYAELTRLLVGQGHRVVVTGSAAEAPLTSAVAGADGIDLAGRTGLWELAAVLAAADVVVAGNTGPAHLAAAAGTPVVSLFAPTVPAAKWAPYGVPTVVLGDQSAPCAGTRAVTCPVPGHPCLTTVTAATAASAVASLVGSTDPGQAPPPPALPDKELT